MNAEGGEGFTPADRADEDASPGSTWGLGAANRLSDSPLETASRASRFGAYADLGSAGQAAIPGLYAWAIAVLPAALARGAELPVKVLVMLASFALVFAAAIERRWPAHARALSVWGFSGASALTWLISSSPGGAHMDPVRGAASVLGFSLYAFASAAPARKADPFVGDRLVPAPLLRPRGQILNADKWILACLVAAALGFQFVGWDVLPAERALLVRLLSIATGLVIASGASSLVVGRYGFRAKTDGWHRMRRALPYLLLLSLVLAAGVATRGLL